MAIQNKTHANPSAGWTARFCSCFLVCLVFFNITALKNVGAIQQLTGTLSTKDTFLSVSVRNRNQYSS